MSPGAKPSTKFFALMGIGPLHAGPFTRAAALAAYLKYVDMKRTFMNLTEASVAGHGEGELWSLDFPVPCGDITRLGFASTRWEGGLDWASTLTS